MVATCKTLTSLDKPMTHPPIILIVNDDPIGRDTLAALLHGQSYTRAFAVNVPEVLAVASQVCPISSFGRYAAEDGRL